MGVIALAAMVAIREKDQGSGQIEESEESEDLLKP